MFTNIINAHCKALIIFSMMILSINANALDADEDLLYDQGVEHYNNGNYGQAIKDFEAVLQANPNNSEAREYLEKARREKGYETPTPDIFNFKDSRDNKTYKAVKIGKQIWMAENLNYNASGSKCYENKSDNCKEHGRLYNWKSAIKACPKGWHLPSNDEWDKLLNAVGGSERAGKYLRVGCGEWSSCIEHKYDYKNEYGFSALPGGWGSIGGLFTSDIYMNIFSEGLWWSTSEDQYVMERNFEEIRRNNNRGLLFSIRCLQDSYGYEPPTQVAASSPSSDGEVKTRFGLRFAIPILNVDYDDEYPETGFGLNGLSFVLSIPLFSRLTIEPEIDVLNYRFFWGDLEGEYKFEEYAISVPLTLRFVTSPPPSFGLYAEAGAQLDFAISTKYTEFDGQQFDEPESIDEREFLGYGLVFGGGFQFNMGDMVVLLGYRYVNSLTDFLTFEGEGYGKLTQHQISLGLLF